ncbi:MAG TPA: hypothetical protein VLE93_03145 [Candidatus Saccharimonadales bacterium]|nr:hypothetical protein [Candidatus Saccharimonadales bacterium]
MPIKFGDVFKFNGKEYIFIAKIDDIIYAAEILDRENSQTILRLADRNSTRGNRLIDTLLYCFVELTTEQFTERVAHMKGAQRNEETVEFGDVNDCLSLADKQLIKRELMDNSKFFAEELIETISRLPL